MSAPAANMRIDPDRLWDTIHEMAEIGPGVAGGNNRQTLTDEDAEGRALFQKWCEEAGCTMGVDEMGTMFATRPGEDPDALPVYVGSHLDTQPTGGRYDGVLGVLGGLEVVRTLNDLGIRTKHPIVVTNWTNEEGTRFAPAMLASGVFAGRPRPGLGLRPGGRQGQALRRRARAHRLEGRREGRRAQDARLFRAAYRTGPDPGGRGQGCGRRHPRAGAALDRMHGDGQGPAHRLDADVHAPQRRPGLARVTELVHEIAIARQPNAVGAIGHIDVYPNSRNIIPEKVVFTVDFRSHVLETLEEMVAEFLETAPGVCADIGVKFKAEIVGQFDPPAFDETLLGASAGRPSGWATATWTSSRARGTTPAGSTAWRRRR
jgi:beta-ureidopropionase / N-carbamoyl-L-amino-acid hydrolase